MTLAVVLLALRLGMGSAVVLLALRLGKGVGQVDIRDAFYNILLPAPLRSLFCLPAIAAGRVGKVEVEGESVKWD